MITLAAVGLGAFVIGYGVTALSFLAGAAPSDVVLVPDVRDLQVRDAARAMDRAGLAIEVGDSFPNPAVPAGAVLAQSPLPLREVSPGTAVRVIISTGRLRPTVPVVESMPLALATRALETAGFTVMVEEELVEGEAGRVVGVEPPAGTPLELPATVRVQLGGKVRYVEMPVLIGMLESEARETAEELGLEVDEVVYEESPFGEPGGVVSQMPAPGDSIAVGSEVRLRVTAPDSRPRRGSRDRIGFRSTDQEVSR